MTSALKTPRTFDRMLIKSVDAGDRASVIGLVEEAGNLSPDEKSCAVELLDQYLNDPLQKDYFFLAAVGPEGRLSGYVCYGPASLADGVYDMYWIVVKEQSRGAGVGARLLCALEKVLETVGARMLVAETSGLDAYGPARRFYLRNGFTEDARIRDFYRPGDDKVVYVKRF